MTRRDHDRGTAAVDTATGEPSQAREFVHDELTSVMASWDLLELEDVATVSQICAGFVARQGDTSGWRTPHKATTFAGTITRVPVLLASAPRGQRSLARIRDCILRSVAGRSVARVALATCLTRATSSRTEQEPIAVGRTRVQSGPERTHHGVLVEERGIRRHHVRGARRPNPTVRTSRSGADNRGEHA